MSIIILEFNSPEYFVLKFAVVLQFVLLTFNANLFALSHFLTFRSSLLTVLQCN